MLSRISILIVTWHGDDLLRDCLDSIAASCGTTPEIVVVDNAVTESCRTLVAHYPNARYVPSPGNPGFAGGNDIGLPHCTREFIVLLNNDTRIHDEPFSQMANFLAGHPRAGIVQGTLVMPHLDGRLDDCGVYLTPFGIQYHRLYGQPLERQTATASSPIRVFAGKGALLMFRREVVDTLGGILFHDCFGSYYEETDFCHRAALVGWECWYLSTPPVEHLCGQTSAHFNSADIWKRYIANILFSFAANFGLFARWRFIGAFLLINVAQILKLLSHWNTAMLRAYLGAFMLNHQRRDILRTVRRQVQSTRVISDRDLLKVSLVHPPFSYYLLSAQARLADYTRDDRP